SIRSTRVPWTSGRTVARASRKTQHGDLTPVPLADASRSFLLRAHLEDGEKRLLRDLHLAHALHPLLAFLLLLEELPLPADVAAVALGDDVLPHGADALRGDDLAAERRLDADLEHLPREDLLQALDELLAARVGPL